MLPLGSKGSNKKKIKNFCKKEYRSTENNNKGWFGRQLAPFLLRNFCFFCLYNKIKNYKVGFYQLYLLNIILLKHFLISFFIGASVHFNKVKPDSSADPFDFFEAQLKKLNRRYSKPRLWRKRLKVRAIILI